MVSRLVLGCGGTCLGLVDELRERRGDLFVVDPDPNRVDQLRAKSINAEVGDPTDPDWRSGVGIDPDVVVVGADEPGRNRRVVDVARSAFPNAHLIAGVGEDATRDGRRALAERADTVFDPGVALVEYLSRILDAGQAGRLRALRSTLSSIDGTLGVFTHDNPDPDAIAAAVALSAVAGWHGVEAVPAYFGSISHQENRAFVNLLDLSLRNVGPDEPFDFDAIALVDHSRPGVNDQLPPETDVAIVIDHHPPKGPVEADFVDVREAVGATSTVLVDYLRGYGIDIDVAVATGLLYGIRVDTKDFAREITGSDFDAAAFLLPHADVEVLKRIESPSISADTLETVSRAIRNRDQRGEVLASCVGRLADRDALAQAADRLLAMEGVSVSLVYGYMEGTIYISARARGVDLDLGDALREAFLGIGSAGGHADMAGAQIAMGLFEDVDSDDDLTRMVEDVITRRFFGVIEDTELEE